MGFISCTALQYVVTIVHINLVKTKRNLLYIRTQFVPRSKHFSTTVIKTNQLMLYKAKVAVCSDIRTKHSTQSERHVQFLNVKPGGT
jgi:hypothetical protein